MQTFYSAVKEAFDGLRTIHGFVRVPAGMSSTLVSFMRRETADVCTYIFIRDERRGSGSVQTHVWIAPIDFPGDGLDRLGVGYKVLIGETWEFDHSFLKLSAQKVESFISVVKGISDVVRDELRRPIFRTKRLEMYLLERELFRWFEQIAERGGALFEAVINSGKLAAMGKLSFASFEARCVKLAAEMLARSDVPTTLKGSVIWSRPELVGAALASQLFAKSLLSEKVMED
jgi:hypothetical protein